MDRDSGKSLRARLYATGAHPAIVDLLADTDRLALALLEDARDAGTHDPGRDYLVEAEKLAPVLALLHVTPSELARAEEVAALRNLTAA